MMQGTHLDPGAIVLRVSTGAAEPKCFLTSRIMSLSILWGVIWSRSDNLTTLMVIHVPLLESHLPGAR